MYEEGWEAKKFKSIDKKDNFEGKTIGSKRGNTYDFRCLKKTFENVHRQRLLTTNFYALLNEIEITKMR